MPAKPLDLTEEQVLWFRARRNHLAGPGAADAVDAVRDVVGAQAQQLYPALHAISLSNWKTHGNLLLNMLQPSAQPQIQSAAMQTIASFADEAAATAILNRWRELTPAVRGQALVALLNRTRWTRLLLDEIGYGIELATDAERGEPIEDEEIYCYVPEIGMVRSRREYEAYPQIRGACLHSMLNGTYDTETRRHAKKLLRQALALQLGDKPLNSRDLFG